jgi:phosphate:Na+ symporter
VQTLLTILAAIALIVWGTRMVRTNVLRVYGAGLRRGLARSVDRRVSACLAGLGVASVLQSSTATALIVASFHSQGLITLAAALAIMLGADVGTALVVQVLALDLSWLAPLLILAGVAVHLLRENSNVGTIGQAVLGIGLILLGLQIVGAATRPLAYLDGVTAIFALVLSDALLAVLLGAVLTILLYSSLTVVLLTALFAASGLIAGAAMFALVLGANLGSGALGLLMLARSKPEARRVALGNFLFKAAGVALALPLLPLMVERLAPWTGSPAQLVAGFHLAFNVLLVLVFLGAVKRIARLTEWLLPARGAAEDAVAPKHLDPTALNTPALAMSCATREALRMTDVIERMLDGVLTLIRTNDPQVVHETREMEKQVDTLYTAVKLYLTQINREALRETETRRWTEIISFTISMEQIGDVVERALIDLEERKIRRATSFSEAGLGELCHLHARIKANLRLAMAVFLHSDLRSAEHLLREKAAFRELELEYTERHLLRLRSNTPQSIGTSALHLDLIIELKRINSLICSVAYPLLDAAGALARSRLRETQAADEADAAATKAAVEPKQA